MPKRMPRPFDSSLALPGQASHAKAQGALAEATQLLKVMQQRVGGNDLASQQLHRVKEQRLGKEIHLDDEVLKGNGGVSD